MFRYLLVLILVIIGCRWGIAQDSAVSDSNQVKPANADTMFVIPAGPVAGSFTSASRVAVVDTIAGWAKIQVEGWVPVHAVMDRLSKPEQNPFAAPSLSQSAAAVPRQQCEAITSKGTRCSRLAQPGAKYCWQHSPNRSH